MTTDITGPINGQLSAVQMLDSLISKYPELPDAYIVIHHPWKGQPSNLHLQLDKPTEFEQWRTALGIASGAVSLHPHGRGSWVEAATVREGIGIDISAHGILLTDDQLNAPRVREDVAA